MNWRRLLFIPPIAIGIAAFVLMTRQDKAPQGARPEAALAVRVIELKPQTLVPSAAGYGRVVAVRTWQAISQVDGRVTAMAGDLSIGTIVDAGATVIQIDRRDYEIAKAKAEANLASAQSQVLEIETLESNTHAYVALERRIEGFLQAEYDRKATLVTRGTSSQATLDQASRDLLGQQRKVLDLDNTIKLYPVQRLSLEAALATRKAELEEAERNLYNTSIVAPFTGRATEENVAVGQYTRPGDRLLTIESIEASEVVAEFQPRSLGALVRTTLNGNEAGLLNPQDYEAAFDVIKRLNLEASVHVTIGTQSFSWPAELVRFSGSADSDTGAVGLVVQVEDPGKLDPVLARPPLNNGTFAEVRLSAAPKEDILLINRSAIHTAENGGAFVYIVDDENRLRRRSITLGLIIGDNVPVVEGLEAGDLIVLSDPQPAVLGMLLELVTEPSAATDAK